MKKAEAESGIRHLCSVYAREHDIPTDGSGDPSFGSFYRWVSENYPAYLNFRSTEGAYNAVEWWWAEEFRQTSRY